MPFYECIGSAYGFSHNDSIFHLFLSVAYSPSYSFTRLSVYHTSCFLSWLTFATQIWDIPPSGLHPLSYFKSSLKCRVTHRRYSPLCVFLIYFIDNSVSSTEKDIDTRQAKVWTAIDKLSVIWKSDLTDKMKRSFFQAAVVSILLYGCTTWTLTKRLEKKLDGNYTRMLRAILNKSWGKHPTKHQLYGHLLPITKTIKVRRTRHAGHCWSSRDELIRDVLLWTPSHSRAKAGPPARTYIQQLCEDTGCSPEDLPEAMNDREEWRERVKDIRAGGTTRWWRSSSSSLVSHRSWNLLINVWGLPKSLRLAH